MPMEEALFTVKMLVKMSVTALNEICEKHELNLKALIYDEMYAGHWFRENVEWVPLVVLEASTEILHHTR